mmetsp:Transcript_23517/g.39735  ORF Transcript_23517/g.39735 Transcript_23517/m.39735 type:complete len:99 (+) Transcript_23517:868-1164(+)
MLSSAVHTLVAAIIWSSGDIFTANAGNFVSRRPACRSGLGDTATRLRTNAMMARVQRRVAPTNDDLHSERHQPHQISEPTISPFRSPSFCRPRILYIE